MKTLKSVNHSEMMEVDMDAFHPPSQSQDGTADSLSLAKLTMLPLYAIIYFYTRPALWAFACGFFCMQIFIITIAFYYLFSTFPYQYDLVVSIFSHGDSSLFFAPIYFITTFLMICVEIVIIFVVLFFAVCKPLLMDWMLEFVLLDHNVPWKPSPRSCCTNIVRLLFFAFLLLFIMLLTFPLNLIPVFGTVLWCICNGFFVAWDLMDVYFDLQRLTFMEAARFSFAHWQQFTCFGTMALAVTLIPFIGIFFAFTDFVAAALWAVEMERTCALEDYVEGEDFSKAGMEGTDGSVFE